MQWFAQAPSNIALIKYMGKQDNVRNLPDNPSLSYTLNHLTSSVRLVPSTAKDDQWEPLSTSDNPNFALSEAAKARFLKHLAMLKAQFHYQGAFIVYSNNNFPHSSGLASSASSFAALTLCAVEALGELTGQPLPSVEQQAQWSRQGSGSSCRSFFPTWALWDGASIKAIEFPIPRLIHRVIIISREEKDVSSSEAHRRVQSSPEYVTRSIRARTRLDALITALNQRNWVAAYQICWDEFQDMHQLFATAAEPFSYMNDQSRTVLAMLAEQWNTHGDGPLVTMDAGPNIHLLYREDQQDLAELFERNHLNGLYDVL